MQEYSAKRELPKINYRIHTDAIKQNLIEQTSIIYANEADVLNAAVWYDCKTMERSQFRLERKYS